MSKLIIEKLNAAHVRVYSDDFGLEQELSDYFAYPVEGAKYMPMYKSGVWDGIHRLYNRQKKVLYTGLYETLIKFCFDNQIEYETNFTLFPPEEEMVSELEILEFIDSLEVAKDGEKIELRDYQIEAIVKSIRERRIVLQSPTSSGKSAVIYVLSRWCLANSLPLLILVPNQGLVNQLYADFEDYSSVSNWNVEKYVQKIMGGFTKDNTHPIKISTWQSMLPLVKANPKYFKEFSSVIVDEAHLSKGQSIQNILEKCTEAYFRVGLTGTIDSKSLTRSTLTGLFGPIYQVTTTKSLMDLGSITKLKISAVLLKYSKEESKLLKGLKYQDEIRYIVENPRRNDFIAKTALATKGNTLILFQFISHGKQLYEIISKLTDRPVYYVSGEVKSTERESIRKEINNQKDAILIASVQTTGTGVNIPALDNVIFSSPTKSVYRVLQSLGRVLRLKDGKMYARLIDIGDSFAVGKAKNTTFLHCIERLRIYALEKLEFKIIEIDF